MILQQTTVFCISCLFFFKEGQAQAQAKAQVYWPIAHALYRVARELIIHHDNHDAR